MFSNRTKMVVYSVAGIAVLLLAMLAWRYRPYTFHGMVMSSPEFAPNFTLLSSGTEQPVSLRDFKGKIVLLYFGYTTCPDVCPATLSDISKALDNLGSRADEVEVLMVTVDPERDSPEILEDYVKHFGNNFLGLIPRSEEEIFAVATQYGIYYEKRNYGSATGYLMDHTATITLIDKGNYVRVIYPFGTEPSDLAADLRYILNRW